MYSIALGHVGEKGAAGAFGHACGVRVDGAAPRGFLRFLGLTAFQAEGCGGGFAAIKRGRGLRRRLCRRVVKGKVDGPPGRRLWPPVGGGLCSLRSGGDSACGAEGCGIAPWAMNIKSALRDLLSVSYGMISILLIGSLCSPPPIRLRHWTHLRCEGS